MDKWDKKKKQKLKNFNFAAPHHGIHLVADWQGGSANGESTLIVKSLDEVPYEEVEKGDDIELKMDLKTFLGMFFEMYYSGSEKLSKLLGLEMSYDKDREEYKGSSCGVDEFNKAASLLKSIYEDHQEISDTDWLSLLQFQKQFEQALEKSVSDTQTEEVSDPSDLASESVEEESSVESSESSVDKEEIMSKDTTQETLLTQADIEKAAAEAVAKAREEWEAEAAHKQMLKDTAAAVERFSFVPAELTEEVVKCAAEEDGAVILKALEAAHAAIAEANGKFDEVKVELEEVKKSFATSQTAIEGEVEQPLQSLSHKEMLAHAIAAEKIRKNK